MAPVLSHKRLRTGRALLAGFVLSAALTDAVLAQNIRDDAARQANQINRLQTEQERLREAETLRETTRAPDGETIAPPEVQTSSTSETCVAVKSISVTGATLIPESVLRRTTTRFAGQCLGLSALNSLLKALTYLYVERGYIASRAYLPEQDLSDGSLKVSVVEGNLENITLNGKPPTDNRLTTAFPGMQSRPANLRDIEQGLDQINRLRSSKAKIALHSGKQQGGSVLDVEVEQGRPWHASLSSDNLGATATGIYQSRIDFGLDNLFGVNDEWQLGYQRSMDHHPLFFNGERPNSNTLTGSLSIPYGYWTASVDGFWSDYHSSVAGPISAIDTSGKSKSLSPSLSRILYRNQTSKTWATGRLTWKGTDNFLLGSRIDVSSRVLTIASLELGHSRQLFGGQASASIGYHRGLDILGAFDDATAPTGSPRGQFDKVTASLGYFRTKDVGSSTLIFNTNVSGQWTHDPLFASEQMSLGGYSTVRGVREAVLYADQAILMRNELSFLLSQMNDAAAVKAIGRLEPYVAVDFGHSVADRRGNSLGGDIVGAAIGIRNKGGRINFDLSYADILSMPDLAGDVKPSSGLVQARVSVSF